MTNEQKARRLDDIATHYIQIGQKDAVLLRECAAMMRKRQAVERDAEGGATEYGLHRWAGPVLNGFISLVTKDGRTLYYDWHPTLEAARAAAMAWVDQQEGK